MKPGDWPPFPPRPDRGQRRYHVSDERLREFAKLTHHERLKWVEEFALFVRLGQQALARLRQADVAADAPPANPERSPP